MRIMDIAFALMVFNLSMGMLNTAIVIDPTLAPLIGSTLYSDISSLNSTVNDFTERMNNTATGMKNQENIITQVFNFLNIAYYGFIVVITILWTLISSTVIGFLTLGNLVSCSFGGGMVCTMGMAMFGIIQIVVWVIYGIGISQWLSGRSYREYQ